MLREELGGERAGEIAKRIVMEPERMHGIEVGRYEEGSFENVAEDIRMSMHKQ